MPAKIELKYTFLFCEYPVLCVKALVSFLRSRTNLIKWRHIDERWINCVKKKQFLETLVVAKQGWLRARRSIIIDPWLSFGFQGSKGFKFRATKVFKYLGTSLRNVIQLLFHPNLCKKTVVSGRSSSGLLSIISQSVPWPEEIRKLIQLFDWGTTSHNRVSNLFNTATQKTDFPEESSYIETVLLNKFVRVRIIRYSCRYSDISCFIRHFGITLL